MGDLLLESLTKEFLLQQARKYKELADIYLQTCYRTHSEINWHKVRIWEESYQNAINILKKRGEL